MIKKRFIKFALRAHQTLVAVCVFPFVLLSGLLVAIHLICEESAIQLSKFADRIAERALRRDQVFNYLKRKYNE